MIIYKPKNTAKKHFPYVNLLLMLILLGGFAALAMYSETAEMPTMDAQPPVVTLSEPLNLSGEWVGMMTEDYGVDRRYDYRIVFTQNGNSVSGMMYQDATNVEPEIYAESTLIGSVEGDTFYFYEARVMVLENVTIDRWCRIEATLEYEKVDGMDTLVGTWDSVEDDRSGCTTIDGRVILTRQD
jgi:hypothetical protein